MSNLNEINTNTSDKKKDHEKSMVEKLNEETAIMNKKRVEIKIKELQDAYHNGEQEKLEFLSKEFKEIHDCLGNDSKEFLDINRVALKSNIISNGASTLNIAKLKNCEAKLGIIKYKSIIKEAAEGPMKNENNKSNNNYISLDKIDGRKLRNGVLIGGVATLVGAVILGASVKSCSNNKDNSNGTTTTNGYTSDESTTTIEQTTETINVTTSTGDYTVETLDVDYSSPTRETTIETDATGGTHVKSKGNKEADPTIKKIRPTTKKDTVTVISKPTNSSDKVSYETSAIPTNEDGVKTDKNGDPAPTTSYVKPKGTDPLPVEPTKKTLSQEELRGETKSTTAETTKAKETSAPKAKETKSTTAETTVNTVLEDKINGKVLVLKLR